MVTELDPDHGIALVIRVEVKVKRIDMSIAMVRDNNRRRDRVFRPALPVGPHAAEPGRLRPDAFVRRQVDLVPAQFVQPVEVVEGERVRDVLDGGMVDLGDRVADLLGVAGGVVRVFAVYPDQGS